MLAPFRCCPQWNTAERIRVPTQICQWQCWNNSLCWSDAQRLHGPAAFLNRRLVPERYNYNWHLPLIFYKRNFVFFLLSCQSPCSIEWRFNRISATPKYVCFPFLSIPLYIIIIKAPNNCGRVQLKKHSEPETVRCSGTWMKMGLSQAATYVHRKSIDLPSGND